MLQGPEKLLCALVCSATGILPRLQIHLTRALLSLFGWMYKAWLMSSVWVCFCFVFFKCALCSCWLFSVLWKISPVLKTFPLRVFNLTLCTDALTFLFLPPSAKEEQCVSEVSGRAAAVGNSRWVTLQPWRCSVWVSNCLWEWKPFDLCDRLCMWGGGPSPPHAKTYRKSCQCLAALRAISGWAEDHRGLTYAVYRWYTNIRLCLLSSVELVPEKSVVERVKASDISSTAGKWAFWLD